MPHKRVRPSAEPAPPAPKAGSRRRPHKKGSLEATPSLVRDAKPAPAKPAPKRAAASSKKSSSSSNTARGAKHSPRPVDSSNEDIQELLAQLARLDIVEPSSRPATSATSRPPSSRPLVKAVRAPTQQHAFDSDTHDIQRLLASFMAETDWYPDGGDPTSCTDGGPPGYVPHVAPPVLSKANVPALPSNYTGLGNAPLLRPDLYGGPGTSIPMAPPTVLRRPPRLLVNPHSVTHSALDLLRNSGMLGQPSPEQVPHMPTADSGGLNVCVWDEEELIDAPPPGIGCRPSATSSLNEGSLEDLDRRMTATSGDLLLRKVNPASVPLVITAPQVSAESARERQQIATYQSDFPTLGETGSKMMRQFSSHDSMESSSAETHRRSGQRGPTSRGSTSCGSAVRPLTDADRVETYPKNWPEAPADVDIDAGALWMSAKEISYVARQQVAQTVRAQMDFTRPQTLQDDCGNCSDPAFSTAMERQFLLQTPPKGCVCYMINHQQHASGNTTCADAVFGVCTSKYCQAAEEGRADGAATPSGARPPLTEDGPMRLAEIDRAVRIRMKNCHKAKDTDEIMFALLLKPALNMVTRFGGLAPSVPQDGEDGCYQHYKAFSWRLVDLLEKENGASLVTNLWLKMNHLGRFELLKCVLASSCLLSYLHVRMKPFTAPLRSILNQNIKIIARDRVSATILSNTLLYNVELLLRSLFNGNAAEEIASGMYNTPPGTRATPEQTAGDLAAVYENARIINSDSWIQLGVLVILTLIDYIKYRESKQASIGDELSGAEEPDSLLVLPKLIYQDISETLKVMVAKERRAASPRTANEAVGSEEEPLLLGSFTVKNPLSLHAGLLPLISSTFFMTLASLIYSTPVKLKTVERRCPPVLANSNLTDEVAYRLLYRLVCLSAVESIDEDMVLNTESRLFLKYSLFTAHTDNFCASALHETCNQSKTFRSAEDLVIWVCDDSKLLKKQL